MQSIEETVHLLVLFVRKSWNTDCKEKVILKEEEKNISFCLHEESKLYITDRLNQRKYKSQTLDSTRFCRITTRENINVERALLIV